jgi:hypothetical protein
MKLLGRFIFDLAHTGSYQAVRSSMQSTVDGLRSKLEKRAQLRAKKSLLQLFLAIHESVGKVEALLGIEAAAGTVDRSAVEGAVSGDGQPAADSGSKEPDSELDIKTMERIAIEFNQLQFLVNRGKGLPFVQNLDSVGAFLDFELDVDSMLSFIAVRGFKKCRTRFRRA